MRARDRFRPRRRVGTLVGSEFGLSLRTRMHRAAWLWLQGARVWLRHEDVTALRIGTASVDAVLSLDVLEHVSEHSRALREFARVLKPGGSLLLTVPFYEDAALGTRIARTDDSGAIEHLGAPEFHGDPLSGGALCFHHFGWDLLDAMRAAGFSDAHACRVQAAGHGVPQGQWVLRARR